MTGIIMMAAGFVLLVSGYFVFAAKEKDFSKEEIEGQIQAVLADGVFTNREKEHIVQLADKYKIDKEELVADINRRLESIDAEAETEIIDVAKKKGNDFESFIVKKFNNKLFSIDQWAGDKYVEGIYDNQTQQPDLVVTFHYADVVGKFAVECKWRSDYFKNGIEFAYDDQLERYKKFEITKNTDVYIALGVGGKASAPKELYLIPLKDLTKPFISKKQLMRYKKEVNDGFYYTMKTRILDISPYPTN